METTPKPRVAGVAGGVGTTTVTKALRAEDTGVYQGRGLPVDLMVCRSTMYSLLCAQRAISAAPYPPVLAVVADLPNGSLTSNIKSRLRMTDGYVAAVVHVPFVPEWRDIDFPCDQAADVLLPGDWSRPVRAFAEAIRDLVEHVTPVFLQRVPAPGLAGNPLPHPVAVPAGWPGTR